MTTYPPGTKNPTDPGPFTTSTILQTQSDQSYSQGYVAAVRDFFFVHKSNGKSKCCDPCEHAFGRFLLGLAAGSFVGLLLGLFIGLFVAIAIKT
jgi:predicted lipid-binding transport protein (Tim44 family)